MNRLLIGIGNRFRSDDGVGPVIAERLEALALPATRVCIASGEGAALMDLWREAKAVYLFDAVSSGKAAGTVHRLDAASQTIPQEFFHYSTHAFSLAEAVELARALDELPPRLIIYGIEGGSFRAGRELSPPVAAAVDEVVERVSAELGATAPDAG